MRLRQCTIAGVAALILFLVMPTQEKKTHHSKAFKHSHLEKVQEHESLEELEQKADFHNDIDKQDEQDDCHKAALHKCGQTFLRAHKLLSYLDDELMAFRTRCGIRTAFFECLKTTKEKICSRPLPSRYLVKVDSEFRRKIADAVWATRVCVLGLKSVKNA